MRMNLNREHRGEGGNETAGMPHDGGIHESPMTENLSGAGLSGFNEAHFYQ